MIRGIFVSSTTDTQRERIRYFLSSIPAFFYRNNLSKLCALYGSDKFGFHDYTPIYETYFHSIKNHRLTLLEIGIGAGEQPKKGGNSLKMWSKYFTRSKILGVDIFDKSFFDYRRMKTFQGNQSDIEFLKTITKEYPVLDIVIDDGSHQCSDIITSFEYLFDFIPNGGFYAIEDTQTSYWNEFEGNEDDLKDEKTTMNYFKSLVDSVNIDEIRNSEMRLSMRKDIEFIHFYHNLIVIKKK